MGAPIPSILCASRPTLVLVRRTCRCTLDPHSCLVNLGSAASRAPSSCVSRRRRFVCVASSSVAAASLPMASRNAIDIFDPSVGKRHAAMEMREKMRGAPTYTGRAHIDPSIQANVAAKIAEALRQVAHNMKAREDERRRRDPTYREDAIDLSTANMLPFDKWVDYCDQARGIEPTPHQPQAPGLRSDEHRGPCVQMKGSRSRSSRLRSRSRRLT